MISYVEGDATDPVGDGTKIIAHVCNDAGGWGAGFVVALSKRWPGPEMVYRDWFRGGQSDTSGTFTLGAVAFVAVAPHTTVANMIAQHGYGDEDGPPIRYDAVRACLTRVADYAAVKRSSVHMPRIGCGLAGGSWEDIEPIIEQTLCAKGIPVTVYDFDPRRNR